MLCVWSCLETAPRLMRRKSFCCLGCLFPSHILGWRNCTSRRTLKSEVNTKAKRQSCCPVSSLCTKKGLQTSRGKKPGEWSFFILLHYAKQLKALAILLDTGSGVNKKLLDITDIAQDLGPKCCPSLLGLYCFTDEDCNCALKRKGKVVLWKKLEKKPQYKVYFAELGNSWEIDHKLVKDLEGVCLR